MSDALVNYSVADRVALVQLNRPQARNAINTEMLGLMLEHLASARDDGEVRVLVVSSSDHMGLSAGADVREELDAEARVRRMELFEQAAEETERLVERTTENPEEQ